jgi:flagellar motility protein MotE (MotC chaperone)
MRADAIRRSKGRKVLPMIAGLLIASGLLRLGVEADLVFAEETGTEENSESMICGVEGGTEALLEAFRAREARLVEREGQLEDRIQALHVTEVSVSEKIAALGAAEESLKATLALAQTAASDDLARLTAVYENMKPADAAALFTEMDPAFAAGFLGLMRPDAAAAVMSNLDAARAYTISALLAGRNANAPTE